MGGSRRPLGSSRRRDPCVVAHASGTATTSGCCALLACLVIADKVFWTDRAATNQTQYNHHHWNTSG
ncbi:MAG: hypothetical protein ACXVBW_15940 [Bdellovibrionota bacterium]